jgi:hypothetical protein
VLKSLQFDCTRWLEESESFMSERCPHTCGLKIVKCVDITNSNKFFQVLAYVSRVHGVELPEDLVDHDSLTLEQVRHCGCVLFDNISAVFLTGGTSLDSMLDVITCSTILAQKCSTLFYFLPHADICGTVCRLKAILFAVRMRRQRTR